MKKSLYEVAGVPPAAPSAVIGMAIQRRLQKMQESGAPDAEAQAYALREAWSVLGDAKRRAAYDAKLAAEAAKAPPLASAKPATAAAPATGVTPVAASVAKPAPPPRVATPDEMELVFIVEEAHAPSRLKTYIIVASVLLAFTIGGLWMMTGGSRGSKGANPAKGAVDGRSPFAKARGAQVPQPTPPAPSPAPPPK